MPRIKKENVEQEIEKIKETKKEDKKEIVSNKKRNPAVLNALKSIKKTFGDRSVFFGDDSKTMDVEGITTGSLGLDCAIGIGGLPKGRIIEISGLEGSGKTLISLSTIAEVQKRGGQAVFIDAEHALTPKWCKSLGVVWDDLLIAQPDSGEEAMDMMQAFVESGVIDIIVLDSVAALVTKREIEGGMGDQHMAETARLMSLGLKKLTPLVSKTQTVCVFINQIRMNIGGYGCFNGQTLVTLADGTNETIANIVNKKMNVEVLSFDEKNNKIIKSKVIAWHKNGKVEKDTDFINFALDGFGGGGNQNICCTKEHEILTEKGWKKAKDITKNDKLLTQIDIKMSQDQKQIILGSMLGDMTVSQRNKNTTKIILQNSQQEEYLKWKLSSLDNLEFNKTKYNVKDKTFVKYSSKPTKEINILTNKYKNQADIVRDIDELGLAVWYMDDGHFDTSGYHSRSSICVKSIKECEAKDIVDILNSKFGFRSSYSETQRAIIFKAKDTIELNKIIYKYVPKSMRYKLEKRFRNKAYYNIEKIENTKVLINTEILNIRKASERQMRDKTKYDITVEGTHTYFVGGNHNGVVVHNSPETQPGGKALKFYSSLRLKVGKVSGSDKKAKDGRKIGHRLKVSVQKNKVGEPFRECEFDLYYLTGIDKNSEISTLATMKGVVKRPNNRRYEYKENVWSSKADYEQALIDDPKLLEQIKLETTEAIKNGVEDVEVGAASSIEKVGDTYVDKTTGEILDDGDEKELEIETAVQEEL